MFRLEREEFVKSSYVSLWALLGLQAGFINAFGFLACGRYVSHVTGFGTQIGMAAAEARPWLAFELLGFPASFIFGAFFSGFWTSARLERSLKPRYDLITLLLPLIVLLLWSLASLGLFGPFGHPLLEASDFILLYLLSFLCGMQNGCFATLTKGQIRTTHLTGISTDIGTDLARLLFGGLKGHELELTKQVNLSRLATFVAFSAGSVVSVFFAQRLEYSALILPLVTSIGILIAVRGIGRDLDRRFGGAQEPVVAALNPQVHQPDFFRGDLRKNERLLSS